MSFDLVPADLLLKILCHLRFKERVRLRGVSRLFRELLEISINTMRSLEINDDLMNYALMIQPFPSLLESCSPILYSIIISNHSVNKWMMNALAESVYPNLGHLEIYVTKDDVTEKLIRRNRNLSSIILNLSRDFEWPEDIVLEQLETLEIHHSTFITTLYLSLNHLIGNVPNLKRLTINSDSKVIVLAGQELNRLVSSTPRLETLNLRFSSSWNNPISSPYLNTPGDFLSSVSTWRLPNLTYFAVAMNYPSSPISISPSILQHFSTTYPGMKTFMLDMIMEIDDQAIVALSKMEHLRELRLPWLEMPNDKLMKMINALQSITVLQLSEIDDQDLPALSQLKNLRELSLWHMDLATSELIDLISNIQWLASLEISKISEVNSSTTLVDFLTSTAACFHRNLEIRLSGMPGYTRTRVEDVELEQMKAIFEDIKNTGGPVVEMDLWRCVRSIRYNS